MTKEEMDFIGSMNMCDEISNEAYQKIMTHCEEEEPCEDCISREEAEAIFKNARKSLYKLSRKEQVKDFQTRETMLLNAEQFIHLLPSVTPQPKVGEWLGKEIISDKVIEEWQSARCSICDKYHTTPYMYYFSHYDYCPHCGARMEVSE